MTIYQLKLKAYSTLKQGLDSECLFSETDDVNEAGKKFNQYRAMLFNESKWETLEIKALRPRPQ